MIKPVLHPAVIYRSLNLVISSATYFIIAFLIGPSSFGNIALYQSIGAILSPFSSLALDDTVLQLNPPSVSSLVRTALISSCITSLVTCIIFNHFINGLGFGILTLLFTLGIFRLQTNLNHAIILRNHADLLYRCELAASIIYSLIALASAIILKHFLVFILFTSFKDFFLFLIKIRLLNIKLYSLYDSFSISEIIYRVRSASSYVLGGLGVSLFLQVDKMIIFMMLGSRELGIYSLASTILESTFIVPTAFCSHSTPVIVQHYNSPHNVAYESQMREYFSRSLQVGFACFLFLFVSGNLLGISTILTSYARISTLLIIFSPAALAISIGISTGISFSCLGLKSIIVYKSWIALFVNVSLNLLLIPYIGLIGAAIATVLAYITSSLIVPLADPRAKAVMVEFYKCSLSTISK